MNSMNQFSQDQYYDIHGKYPEESNSHNSFSSEEDLFERFPISSIITNNSSSSRNRNRNIKNSNKNVHHIRTNSGNSRNSILKRKIIENEFFIPIPLMNNIEDCVHYRKSYLMFFLGKLCHMVVLLKNINIDQATLNQVIENYLDKITKWDANHFDVNPIEFNNLRFNQDLPKLDGIQCFNSSTKSLNFISKEHNIKLLSTEKSVEVILGDIEITFELYKYCTEDVNSSESEWNIFEMSNINFNNEQHTPKEQPIVNPSNENSMLNNINVNSRNRKMKQHRSSQVPPHLFTPYPHSSQLKRKTPQSVNITSNIENQQSISPLDDLEHILEKGKSIIVDNDSDDNSMDDSMDDSMDAWMDTLEKDITDFEQQSKYPEESQCEVDCRYMNRCSTSVFKKHTPNEMVDENEQDNVKETLFPNKSSSVNTNPTIMNTFFSSINTNEDPCSSNNNDSQIQGNDYNHGNIISNSFADIKIDDESFGRNLDFIDYILPSELQE